jgi:RimJ/RimL family protein N-acetyltransferase
MWEPGEIGFKALDEGDLPLMHRWMHVPYVLRWWKEPLTEEEVTAKYQPRIAGREPTRCFFIIYRSEAVGYIQSYRMGDYPDYCRAIDVEEDAAGVDLFIGEPEYLYQGLGPLALRKFLQEVVFGEMGAPCCWIGPQEDNRAAIRAYEKAGFHWVKTVHVPGEDAPEYLMRTP